MDILTMSQFSRLSIHAYAYAYADTYCSIRQMMSACRPRSLVLARVEKGDLFETAGTRAATPLSPMGSRLVVVNPGDIAGHSGEQCRLADARVWSAAERKEDTVNPTVSIISNLIMLLGLRRPVEQRRRSSRRSALVLIETDSHMPTKRICSMHVCAYVHMSLAPYYYGPCHL